MRLSDFILENMETILSEWENFARTLSPTTERMNVTELRDDAGAMLGTIAADLACPQTETESIRKSHGRAPEADAVTPAETHAETRLKAGFSIDQLIAEYRALRASVLRLWANTHGAVADSEVRDITRFNEAIDQALAESVRRYAFMGRQAQDIFIGILGHDLRSPLQAVSLGAEMLMGPAASHRDLGRLGSRMLASCTRMAEMLDNLLDFAASRVGQGIPIRPQDADVEEVAEQVIEELRTAYPLSVIHLTAVGDTRGCFDPGRIAQVLQNLSVNALQHGAKQPVSVRIEQRGDKVVISVHNSGRPIPPEAQEHIFDLFHRHAQQGDSEITSKNLGLGLFITKEIVNAHKGRIEVVSPADGGTTFTVTVPRHPTLKLMAEMGSAV